MRHTVLFSRYPLTRCLTSPPTLLLRTCRPCPATLTKTYHNNHKAQAHAFTTSFPLLKKSKPSKNAPSTSSSSSPTQLPEADPADLSPLRESISKVLTALTENLTKLRPSGRFDPSVLETLRITLKPTPPSSTATSARLADLAQLTPLSGRQLSIHVSAREYLKPVLSALSAPPSNLNLPSFAPPQATDPNEPLKLVLNIPSPTREDRDRAVKEAEKQGERAKREIGEKRGACQKKLRKWEVEGGARKDDLVRVKREMEKVVEEGVKAVKARVEGVTRGKA